MRILFWVCLALLSGLATSATRSQQQVPARIALVIGNAEYPDAPEPLSTPIADARAVADELRRSGFEVDLKLNLGKSAMRSVFIFQEQPFAQSREEVSEETARGWLREGFNVLPRELTQRAFADGDCTALIYEFASTGAVVSRVASRLTGRQHLEKAGVLAYLHNSRN